MIGIGHPEIDFWRLIGNFFSIRCKLRLGSQLIKTDINMICPDFADKITKSDVFLIHLSLPQLILQITKFWEFSPLLTLFIYRYNFPPFYSSGI